MSHTPRADRLIKKSSNVPKVDGSQGRLRIICHRLLLYMKLPGLQCFPLTATSHDRRTAIYATDYEKLLTGVDDTVSIWVFRCVSF